MGKEQSYFKPEHGHSRPRTPTYNTWRSMRARCHNPKVDSYQFYGARGICVCPEWVRFENFLRDMGERPEGYTLDRINPELDYYKENCRWLPGKTNCSRCKK